MSLIVEFELPMELKSSGNMRHAPMQRHRVVKEQRTAVAWGLRCHAPGAVVSRPFPDPLRVTLTRISPRRLDDDNLRGAFKGVRDEVASWLGRNDNDPLICWAYAQGQHGKKATRIRIRIEEV